ncbi:MAG: SpoIIE family protein phosphatase [Acidobacteriota bacterium]
MKRFAPWLAFLVGVILLAVLLPFFDSAQPQGLKVTRNDARRIADAEARRMGIEVEKAWTLVTWEESPLIEKELQNDRARRLRALGDPVVGPRLSYYRVTYFRKGLEKFPPYGQILVGKEGNVVGARRTARAESPGAKPSVEQIKPIADQFLASHALAGSPAPTYESARPTQLNSRVDTTLRYRVPSKFPSGNVVYYVYLYFVGDKFAGWEPIEEYSDGSHFRFGSGEAIAGTFIQYGVLFTLLLVLLIIFLRMYHAGEVGVGTAVFLFAVTLFLMLATNILSMAENSFNVGFGGVDARSTALAEAGFVLLFYNIPMTVLVFLGWSVGESFARERWSERLASFDAILRREPLNATVGDSLLKGLLASPAVAAAALLPGAIGIMLGFAHSNLGPYSQLVLSTSGGLITLLAEAAVESLSLSVVAILFILAFFNRRRIVWAGVLVAATVGSMSAIAQPPIGGTFAQIGLSFGATLAACAVFLTVDLLGATVAVFCGILLVGILPYVRATSGVPQLHAMIVLFAPMAAILAYSIPAILTRRHVHYEYDDLAPHVRRIIERERVKAEIDAANRIQAALLPSSDPQIHGATVASSYRSATEIGGDYFDFLPLDNGDIGLAFGDVAGHGLTSGIVMAMAKSALLVQVGHDSSPRRVMEVLNETVIKTAPRRMMMTFFFGLLDPISHRLRFSSAGHLDPYVFRAKLGILEPLSAWGFPLGVRRRDPFRELDVTFEAGDRLILYSDGLIEAVDDDGEPFGFSRFERVLLKSGELSAEEIKKSVLDSVKRFTHNRPPADDQTLVVISFEEGASAPFFETETEIAREAMLPN